MEKKDIEHLAKLARIELSVKETESLADDITSILGYVSEVSDITSSTTHEKRVGAVSNVLRDDGEPSEPGTFTEKLLNEAPERQGRYIKVKKILGDTGS